MLINSMDREKVLPKVAFMLVLSFHLSAGDEVLGIPKVLRGNSEDLGIYARFFDVLNQEWRTEARREGADNARATGPDPMVKTTSGLVRGISLPEAHGFYEIPYAEPPVGERRFREPRPVQESSATIDARVNDNIVCYQTKRNCSEGRCFTNLNEDCLVLNVHVPLYVDLHDPDVLPETKLPVLFFIHGGLFLYGSGTSTQSDGRWLSNATNTVIVTINYRLGALGFLVYGEGEDAIKGNQGLKDQQLAMQWVQDNIEHFGGDKNRVTLFGHSAGAQSIFFHLLSDVSKPLFQRAIMQSLSAFLYTNQEEALAAGNVTVQWLNCTAGDETQCLLDAAPEQLVEAATEVRRSAVFGGDFWSGLEPLRPVLDGKEWTGQPMDMFRDGEWQTDKEVLMGSNLEESIATNNYVEGERMSRAEFYAYNRYQFGDEIGNNVSQKYESMMEEGERDYTLIYGIELTDGYYACPTRALARFAAADQKSVFLYVSAYAPSGPYCEAINEIPERCGLAYRTSELPVIFRSGPSYGYIFNENDTACSDQFGSYWGGFARTGNPSDGVDPPLAELYEWRQYNSETGISMRIQAPKEKIDEFYLHDICDFWDDLDFYVEMRGSGAVKCVPYIQLTLLTFVALFLLE